MKFQMPFFYNKFKLTTVLKLKTNVLGYKRNKSSNNDYEVNLTFM